MIGDISLPIDEMTRLIFSSLALFAECRCRLKCRSGVCDAPVRYFYLPLGHFITRLVVGEGVGGQSYGSGERNAGAISVTFRRIYPAARWVC